MTDAVWRVDIDGAPRWAVGPSSSGPKILLRHDVGLDDVLRGRVSFTDWMAAHSEEQVPASASVLAPIEGQEVWAAGVTFKRSQDARRYESSQPDHYDHVYDADRPELFFKAPSCRVRGPNASIGIRRDSTWDVPEPEVALVADHHANIVAITLGNDVSSREIEGQNPLYLPQAKMYEGSCAIGPCLVPVTALDLLSQVLSLRIDRGEAICFDDVISLSEMKRTPDELVAWLFKAMDFPVGAFLLTGTGLVPEADFTLEEGDTVSIALEGTMTLTNPVQRVGIQ